MQIRRIKACGLGCLRTFRRFFHTFMVASWKASSKSPGFRTTFHPTPMATPTPVSCRLLLARHRSGLLGELSFATASRRDVEIARERPPNRRLIFGCVIVFRATIVTTAMTATTTGLCGLIFWGIGVVVRVISPARLGWLYEHHRHVGLRPRRLATISPVGLGILTGLLLADLSSVECERLGLEPGDPKLNVPGVLQALPVPVPADVQQAARTA